MAKLKIQGIICFPTYIYYSRRTEWEWTDLEQWIARMRQIYPGVPVSDVMGGYEPHMPAPIENYPDDTEGTITPWWHPK